MGEGATPLVAIDGGLRLKLDFLMPTLSFKDRGSVVLVAKAAEIGVRRLVADSSGNAGASIAAYAARAGMAAEVFVPAATSEKKVAQLRGYGATVHCVAGAACRGRRGGHRPCRLYRRLLRQPRLQPALPSRDQDFRLRAVGTARGTPARHGPGPRRQRHPAHRGEHRFQRNWPRPGSSSTCPGWWPYRPSAARRWRDAARLAGPGPRSRGRWGRDRPPGRGPAAEGIAIAEPARLAQMLDVVSESGGTVITATEQGIASARLALAAKGIDVEPTAAIAYAAWLEWPEAPAAVVHRPGHDRCGPQVPAAVPSGRHGPTARGGARKNDRDELEPFL